MSLSISLPLYMFLHFPLPVSPSLLVFPPLDFPCISLSLSPTLCISSSMSLLCHLTCPCGSGPPGRDGPGLSFSRNLWEAKAGPDQTLIAFLSSCPLSPLLGIWPRLPSTGRNMKWLSSSTSHSRLLPTPTPRSPPTQLSSSTASQAGNPYYFYYLIICFGL